MNCRDRWSISWSVRDVSSFHCRKKCLTNYKHLFPKNSGWGHTVGVLRSITFQQKKKLMLYVHDHFLSLRTLGDGSAHRIKWGVFLKPVVGWDVELLDPTAARVVSNSVLNSVVVFLLLYCRLYSISSLLFPQSIPGMLASVVQNAFLPFPQRECVPYAPKNVQVYCGTFMPRKSSYATLSLKKKALHPFFNDKASWTPGISPFLTWSSVDMPTNLPTKSAHGGWGCENLT